MSQNQDIVHLHFEHQNLDLQQIIEPGKQNKKTPRIKDRPPGKTGLPQIVDANKNLNRQVKSISRTNKIETTAKNLYEEATRVQRIQQSASQIQKLQEQIKELDKYRSLSKTAEIDGINQSKPNRQFF